MKRTSPFFIAVVLCGLGWVANAQETQPKAPTIPFATPGSGVIDRTVQSKLADSVNLADYVSDTSGATDDTTGIQKAINALPAVGGTILVNCGQKLKITSSINIGNGTSSAASTVRGVFIKGQGVPLNDSGTSYFTSPGSCFSFVAGASIPGGMFQINGPVDGWGFENVQFDCNSLASYGLIVSSGANGRSRNIAITNCKVFGLYSTTVPPFARFLTDALNNVYDNVYVKLAVGATGGIMLTGSGTIGSSPASYSDTDYNYFHNVRVQGSGFSASQKYIYLQNADSNRFEGVQCLSGQLIDVCVFYDFTGTPGHCWPVSNVIDTIDWGLGFSSPIYTAGTPASCSSPNPILSVLRGNGGRPVPFQPMVPQSDGTLPVNNGMPILAAFTIASGSSQLPIAGVPGRIAYVTDQMSRCPLPGGLLSAGGGSVKCVVFDNGSNWVGF